MIAALYRYPRRERRAMAQQWARRSNGVQFANRIARGPDAETLRLRALHDARGKIVRDGVTYFGSGRVVGWCVRRSFAGRVDQFDVVVDGVVWRTGGTRWVRRWMGRSAI